MSSNRRGFSVALMLDDTILVREGRVRFTFRPLVLAGEGSVLKRKTLANTIGHLFNAPWADNNGYLPFVVAPGMNPNGIRRTAVECQLRRLVRRIARRAR